MSQRKLENHSAAERGAGASGRSRSQLAGALMLLGATVIWGTAFVSQSIGSEYVGPFTFLALRCWVAVAFLIPLTIILTGRRKRKAGPSAGRGKGRLRAALIAGAACGTALFVASAAQQIGIGGTTTAKASFITVMYVVIVPVLSVFRGKKPNPGIWLCVGLGITGLYFLCMKGDSMAFGAGDAMVLLSAFFFSIQILVVDHFSGRMPGVVLSLLQVLVEGILATVFMFLLEKPSPEAIAPAMPSILYAGVMSSGVAYTLQIMGQRRIDPTVASLIMCLESVFGALGGWLIQHQALSGREILGCALMFLAVVLSQLPIGSLIRRNARARRPLTH